MNSQVFEQCLSELRVMQALFHGKERILLIDNAPVHKKTPGAAEALAATNIKLLFLPKNATDMCQSAQFFHHPKDKVGMEA